MGSNSGSQLQQMSEAEIVEQHYFERASSSGTSEAYEIDELSSIKYVITSEFTNDNWADGEIVQQMGKNWGSRWAVAGSRVKFFCMPQEYSSEAKREELFKKVDELVKLPGCSNVFTPIFATYNVRMKKAIVCYPYFDQCFKEWLPSDVIASDEHSLPPVWSSLIRSVLPCITRSKMLNIGRFEDELSYVWVAASKEIMVVLFPMEQESKDVIYCHMFGKFLRQNLYNRLVDPDLLNFIMLLEGSQDDESSLELIGRHPLMQSLDALSELIRTTWRESKSQTQQQTNALEQAIVYDDWAEWNKIQDPVLASMLTDPMKKKKSNDANGLFSHIREICAHYTEEYRTFHKTLSPGPHPMSVVKRCYPGIILHIYSLNSNPNWLAK